MEDAEIWLKKWESYVHEQRIQQNEFLTRTTASYNLILTSYNLIQLM